jgi:hypothetical protein
VRVSDVSSADLRPERKDAPTASGEPFAGALSKAERIARQMARIEAHATAVDTLRNGAKVYHLAGGRLVEQAPGKSPYVIKAGERPTPQPTQTAATPSAPATTATTPQTTTPQTTTPQATAPQATAPTTTVPATVPATPTRTSGVTGGPPPDDVAEIDVNGDGKIDAADVTALVTPTQAR